MPRYQADQNVPYFCTITVLEWLPVFIDRPFCDLIVESLSFCRRQKGLRVYAYVIMPNHAHLVLWAEGERDAALHPIMRDLKRFTSRGVHDRLRSDGRRTWLEWLAQATEPGRRARGELGLWRDGFHPQAILKQEVFEQKVRYLHENPVRKGFVQSPQEWWFGSARNFAGLTPVAMEIDPWPGF